MVEQGLMVDSLGLPKNEPMGILLGGGCRLRGGVGSLSLCWDRLLWSHWGRSSVRVLTDNEYRRERAEGKPKYCVGGK